MKIIYLVLEKDKEKKCDSKTSDSLKGKKHLVVSDEFEVGSLDLKKYSHCIIVPNGAVLSENYEQLIQIYFEEDAIMLPLVGMSAKNTNGVLNGCIWNPNLNETLGELNYELSLKQIDSTLFGALIPIKLMVEENLNKELKYYNHFYFLNKMTFEEKKVIGVPKLLMVIDNDLSFPGVSDEEKMHHFKLAMEVEPKKVAEEEETQILNVVK